MKLAFAAKVNVLTSSTVKGMHIRYSLAIVILVNVLFCEIILMLLNFNIAICKNIALQIDDIH